MSASLVRLYRKVTGATDARATPPAPAVEPTEPRIIREVRERLEVRFGANRAPAIYRYVMRSRISLQSIETVFVVEEQTHRYLFEDGPSPAQLPLVLVIERTAHDTTLMPVAVQIGLHGLRSQYAPPFAGADDRSLSSEDTSLAQVRDDVLDPQEKVRCVGGGRTLLSSVLVFHEPLSQTSFSSIDAIGFQPDFFFTNVATRVPTELALRYQRLFWRRRGALSPGSSNKSLHALAGGAHDFYRVPMSYTYTPLLLGVHAHLCAHDTTSLVRDATTHELPTAHNCVLFEYGALHAAVDFIDEHLLGIHPRIDPRALELTALPFAAIDWQAVYDERRTRDDDGDDTDDEHMEVLVEHCIYYAFVSSADEAPLTSVPPSRSQTPETDNEVDYTAAQPIAVGNEDDEDEASLDFQTPRSVHPTPRPSTLAGFFDMAIAAAVGTAPVTGSETLIDYAAVNPLLIKTPLRAQIGPLSPGRAEPGPLSPRRSPPLPPPQLILQQTHFRTIAEVAGAAQSDDCSEASVVPAEASVAPTEQSSTSASIEARAVLTRTLLLKANQNLRAATAVKGGVST